MANLQVLSDTNSQVHFQEVSGQRVPGHTKQTAQEQRLSLEVAERSSKVQTCEEDSNTVLNSSQIVEFTNDSNSKIKETIPQKSLQWKADLSESHSLNTPRASKPQSPTNRTDRPTSSKTGSHRENLSNSRGTPHKTTYQPGTPRTTLTDSVSLTPPAAHREQQNNNRRSSSRLSFHSPTSHEERDIENINPISTPGQRPVSCDPLLPRRSSSQSRFHDGCFPKEDPALIIGSPYRIQSARERRAKPTRKRPTTRYREPVFTNKELVVNLIFTAQTEAEEDELSRARAETERDARALRSGGLSSGSFSKGFFNQNGRWAYFAHRQKRVLNLNSQQNYNQMAGTLGSSGEYPTLQEDDRSMSRYTYSRQSCSPHSEAGTPLPGAHLFRPTSDRSLISSSRQTDSPQSEAGRPHPGSGFLYQMIAFDNLADNVPPFVQQNIKKNGRMQTESFILRLNYLRRRRALGETSGTINNNPKAKSMVVTSSNSTGTGGAATTGQGDFNSNS